MTSGAALQADAYPIARHGPSDIVARRSGRVLSGAEFWRDVAVLAARLPDKRYIVNLCADRYRFMVGFTAALCRGQTSLMPSAGVPGALSALAADYADLYALTDTAPPPLPYMAYPKDLGDGTATPALPAVAADQPAVVQFTSGSTGQPKPVPKTWSTLVHSARAAGTRLQAAALPRATIIGTVPHQHSYGLESVILLALQHGFAVEVSAPLYPADVVAALARAPRPRILVTTPVHLRALVAEPDGVPPADLVLSATAPLHDQLAKAAETCFSAPLIEIYGCTEAGQVATRRTAQETEWQCFDGVALHQDEMGSWASGPAVEGTAPLQDVIELTGPRHFRLGARAADLVNVAGKRTSFSYLNHQLRSIQGVEDGVFLIDEEKGGPVARVMAVAVAPGLTPEAILRALRERIDAAFLPRPLLLVEALPRNALGKLPRAELLRLFGRGAMSGWQTRELFIPGDHPSAEGHFPGNPIVPGALLLDAAVAAIAGAPGDGRVAIRAAKFLRPVRHGSRLALRWQPLGGGLFRFECWLAEELALTGTLEHSQGAI